MKILRQKKAIFMLVVGILIALIAINRINEVSRAHATFENYYKFRGCTELLQKADDYGLCRTDLNQIIKIVKYQGKWYLDGDLPCSNFLCF